MTVFRDEHSLNNNIFTSTHYAEGFVVLEGEGVKLSIGERSSQLFDEWKIENGKWEIVYGQEKFPLRRGRVKSLSELANFRDMGGGSTRRARTWR